MGRVLGGRYRLLAAIGSGASGQVYRAWDTSLARDVAIKLLHAPLTTDGAFLRRFQAEARSAAGLSHPNIVSVLDSGDDNGEPYLVMEFLAGGSLRDMLDSGALLDQPQVAALGLQAASALAYAHSRGVVHRDIKPANLLFDHRGSLRIVDFGVARALAEASWTEPMGGLVGTVRYASPEQALGAPTDGKADVYALGLVMVEAVTGRLPFLSDTTVATLMARVGTDLGSVAELGVLAGIVESATRCSVAQRSDAASLVGRLQAAMTGLPSPAPLPLVQSPNPAEPDPFASTRHGAADPPGGTRTHEGTTVGPPDGYGHGAGAAATLHGGSPFDTGTLHGGSPPGGEPSAEPAAMPGAAAARRRRRRWPWMLLALFVLGLGVAGASWLLLPSYPEPGVVGLTEQNAAAVLRRSHLRLEVVGHRYDTAVRAGSVASQSPAPGTALGGGAQVSVTLSEGPPPRPVPNLSGDTGQAAAAQLSAAGFGESVSDSYSETVPSGQVISWSPSSGMHSYGTVVSVTVSKGPKPRKVPSLSGDGLDHARRLLAALGLGVSKQEVYSSSVKAGKVVATVPSAGQSVQRGSTITVEVSKGPQMVVVPQLFGHGESRAADMLSRRGLSAGPVYGPDPTGTVLASNPSPGSKVPVGTAVALYTV